MKGLNTQRLSQCIGARGKRIKPYLNWEGFYFLAIGALLLFQEYFLGIDSSGIASSHPLLVFYMQFTSSILTANKIIAAPFLGFCLYAMFAGTSAGLRRRLCDILGFYYFFRMVTLLVGLNILIFDFASSRLLLITQLLFFLPYSLLVWGWTYWRLDICCRANGKPLFRIEHEADAPRVVDYFVAAFSTVFSASIDAIKGTSARSRILVLFHGFVIYDVLGLILSRAVALAQQ